MGVVRILSSSHWGECRVELDMVSIIREHVARAEADSELMQKKFSFKTTKTNEVPVLACQDALL